jgi:hypothetical protein
VYRGSDDEPEPDPMTATHNILVCTEDSVLAKKVRILLSRDEFEVEILSNPRRLDRRLAEDEISLLVLSGRLNNEDAINVVSRLAQSTKMPPTIVIGSTATTTPDFVSVISDPADTQAIYRLASDALAKKNGSIPPAGVDLGRAVPVVLDKQLGDATKTQRMKRPSRDAIVRDPTARSSAAPEPEKDKEADDLGGLVLATGEPVAAQFGGAALDETFDPLAGTPVPVRADADAALEDITVFDVASYHASSSPRDNLGLAGTLEPSGFAKALFQCWTMEAQGALVVANGEETITVSFEDGLPVHIESNVHGDLFGKNLVSKGKLTDGQYSESAKMAIERGLSIGGAIVELGFLNRDAYGRELGEDAHDRIVRRFGMRGGAFEFVANKKPPIADRPYRISVGRILVEGLKRFADDQALNEICGQVESRYFKLRSSIDELTKRFPLTEKEKAFLAFSGRAYNAADAAEVSGLDPRGARVLMSLLITCDEVEDFTPGVTEFEARIREERQRQSEKPAEHPRLSARPEPMVPSSIRPSFEALKPAQVIDKPSALGDFMSAVPPSVPPAAPILGKPLPSPASLMASSGPAFSAGATQASANPIANASTIATGAPESAHSSRSDVSRSEEPANGGSSSAIPPMPTPPNGTPGRTPRPVVFSPPLPRGADGMPQETAERTRSRQHFQRGVTLLGQGNFDDAEEAFRDAIALCSEEHVYLIGLARAVYYNPSYTAVGKVPVLRTIVDRAGHLAPDDGRVITLSDWVRHAEIQLRH